jgi:hypothetical protein
MNKIPAFLHIPKNAGTYVLSWTMKLFRYYAISNSWNNKKNWNLALRRILLQNEDKQQIATVFAYDPEGITNSNENFRQHETDKYCNYVNVKSFLTELKNKKIQIFSLIVEGRGVYLLKENFWEDMLQSIGGTPVFYTVFRNIYDRTESLYNYINSDNSKHEQTHNSIKSNTFEEYIKSYQLEDSWLIRALTKTSDYESIDEFKFDEACQVLDKFQISDITNVDNLFNKIFNECYGIDQSIVPSKDTDINKNSTVKERFDYNKLNEETKTTFLRRTEFDRRLYTKYCK